MVPHSSMAYKLWWVSGGLPVSPAAGTPTLPREGRKRIACPDCLGLLPRNAKTQINKNSIPLWEKTPKHETRRRAGEIRIKKSKRGNSQIVIAIAIAIAIQF